MTKQTYVILAGGVEEELPNGYPNVQWVYIDEITTDAPPEEIQELIYKVALKTGNDLLAEEIKQTVKNAEHIRVLQINNETTFT